MASRNSADDDLYRSGRCQGFRMFVMGHTKIWLKAACLVAAFAYADVEPARAQVNSSEYAPLAGAPAPGERKGPDIPHAATPPAMPEASAVKVSEPAPSAPAIAPPAPEPPAPMPPTIVTAPAEVPAVQPLPTAAEKAAEKKKAALDKSVKKEKEAKGERSVSTDPDDALPRGRIPEDGTLKNAARLPADDKGPRAISFIGSCLNNYDNCMQFVREQVEKIPKSDICFPEGVDQVDITEKVRKFITLRPAIHSQAANRVVTEALYGIYPCKRAASPARTAGAPKGAKATQ